MSYPSARTLLIPIAGVLLAACSTSSGSGAPAVRYLALGDSYTIGQGVEAEDSWPEVLAQALETQGFGDVEVEMVAQTGWTTGELEAAIEVADLVGPFDLVTLLIGVNDQYRGLGLTAFSEGFARLLDRAIELAGGEPSRVVVVSIPDWGATPVGFTSDPVRIAQEIDAYNAAAREIATDRGVEVVSVTAISRAGGTGMIAADGLHPSAAQYVQWVQTILPAARLAVGG